MATLTNEELVEVIGGKTVLELCDLIKAIEDKFGVKAAAPVAMAAAPAGISDGALAARWAFLLLGGRSRRCGRGIDRRG